MGINVIGSYSSLYDNFNTAMIDFMTSNSIKAGQFTVRHAGATKISVAYLDSALSAPLFNANSMLRIMSITKMLVRVIVRGVCADYGQSFDKYLLGDLLLPPLRVVVDQEAVKDLANWSLIRVSDCYNHFSGLQANNDAIATFNVRVVGQAQFVNVPGIIQALQYNLINVSVDVPPPAPYYCCNFNYQVLVAWCMSISNLDYAALLDKYVFSKLANADFAIARAMWNLRHPREAVRYDDHSMTGATAYDSQRIAGAYSTSATAGGDSFLEELALGSSSLIATTAALCDFAEHFDTDGNATTTAANQGFEGHFTGTNAGLFWNSSLTRYAWNFNSDNGDPNAMASSLNAVCSAFDVSGWP